jgi:hypothetical protein
VVCASCAANTSASYLMVSFSLVGYLPANFSVVSAFSKVTLFIPILLPPHNYELTYDLVQTSTIRVPLTTHPTFFSFASLIPPIFGTLNIRHPVRPQICHISSLSFLRLPFTTYGDCSLRWLVPMHRRRVLCCGSRLVLAR